MGNVVVVKRPKLNFLERIYLWEIARGMVITLRHFVRNLFNPCKVPTLNYPEQKRVLAPNYRGRHRLLKDEKGELKCRACKLCALACPSSCIVVEPAKLADPKAKKYPAQYDLDMSRCTFCGFCVEACPFEALDMNSGIYELGGSDPEFIYNKEKLSSY